MKVKRGVSYKELLKKPPEKKIKPSKPSKLLGGLIRLVSIPDLAATNFTYKKIDMDRLGEHEPCLILMNHSSFIDLKIANKLLYPRRYNIVTTSDGFIGRDFLMRHIGCIPTKNSSETCRFCTT